MLITGSRSSCLLFSQVLTADQGGVWLAPERGVSDDAERYFLECFTTILKNKQLQTRPDMNGHATACP